VKRASGAAKALGYGLQHTARVAWLHQKNVQWRGGIPTAAAIRCAIQLLEIHCWRKSPEAVHTNGLHLWREESVVQEEVFKRRNLGKISLLPTSPPHLLEVPDGSMISPLHLLFLLLAGLSLALLLSSFSTLEIHATSFSRSSQSTLILATAAAAAPLASASTAPAAVPSPSPCFKPDAKAKDCFRNDPSLLRQFRAPVFTNLSALPSYGLGGGLFPGRFVPGPLDLVVCYLSRAREKNAARRAMLRQSLALLDTATYRVAYYWLLTPPTDAAVLAALLAENATHGDLAFASATIEDGELTGKVWAEMRHAAALKQAPFWAKMDDDAAILWDRFLPTLYKEMPRQGLVWCSQGSGQGGLYCTGPYLFSMDVVQRFASDEGACCGGGSIDDWWFPNRGWNNRAIWNFGADRRWHNDDMGQEYICACKPWTLTSDSLVVHKVNPPLLEAWLTNKTRFALLGQPHHRYGYNVCAPGDDNNPACNYVPACTGPPPAPTDCIIWPTEQERQENSENSARGDGRNY
jgi:hypothetical protein